MLEDVAEEASNSGTTLSKSIVRAATLAQYQAKRPETKVGDVFLKFTETSGAEKCFLSLNGTPPLPRAPSRVWLIRCLFLQVGCSRGTRSWARTWRPLILTLWECESRPRL